MVVLPGLQERLADIGRGIAEKAGFEFVHCQIAGSRRSPVVRVFIDKPSGVTIDDCAIVSEKWRTCWTARNLGTDLLHFGGLVPRHRADYSR